MWIYLFKCLVKSLINCYKKKDLVTYVAVSVPVDMWPKLSWNKDAPVVIKILFIHNCSSNLTRWIVFTCLHFQCVLLQLATHSISSERPGHLPKQKQNLSSFLVGRAAVPSALWQNKHLVEITRRQVVLLNMRGGKYYRAFQGPLVRRNAWRRHIMTQRCCSFSFFPQLRLLCSYPSFLNQLFQVCIRTQGSV